MSLIITGTTHTGVTLVVANNPVTINQGALLDNASGGTDALYGPGRQAWTITNGGDLNGVNNGIHTVSDGTVTNTGEIEGLTGNGILIAGGSVTNQNVIQGSAYGIFVSGGAGIVTNAVLIMGSSKTGVWLADGGAVANQTTKALIFGKFFGISSNGAPGAVGNLGTIEGGSVGVRLGDGGTVSNSGSILGTGSLGTGVSLSSGGIYNQIAGTISGGAYGVVVEGAGTVTNAGAVSGTTGNGISMYAGGAATNQTGGDIRGGFFGIYCNGAVETVTNAGTITGTVADGIRLSGGGSVSNTGTITGCVTASGVLVKGGGVSNQTGGKISGGFYGLLIAVSGTVVNAGAISGATKDGVGLSGGGEVTNQAGGVIGGGNVGIYSKGAHATVTNVGIITGTSGVQLAAGGSVANSGTITGGPGATGVILSSGGLSNQPGGKISGGVYGALIGAAGTVTNAGVISGSGKYGVAMIAGGAVTNQSTGTISGGAAGAYANGTAATVINAGDISGNTNAGVLLSRGGGVINQTSGTISGMTSGITIAGAAGTVVNAGTLRGFAYSVGFGTGFANRLVIDPGAVFVGKANGGNALGSGVVSTLELASAATAGTLTGFGTQYLNFAQVSLDPGASWSVSGAIPSGTSVAFSAASGEALALGTPRSMAGTISGFGIGDVLALNGITDATTGILGAGNLLTVSESGGQKVTLQFDPTQSFAGDTFQESVSALGTTITLALATPPVIAADLGLNVPPGGSGTITSGMLLASENGVTPAQLIYTLTTAPAHGSITKGGITVTVFTQADINSGAIAYVESGAATSDTFSFKVTDPNNASLSGSFPITISASPAKPVLSLDTGLTVAVGATGTIGASALLTSETGAPATQLTYTVTKAPSDGTLLKNGQPAGSFTQADINAGAVSYAETVTAATSDAFTFTVTDQTGGSASGSFPITIQSGGTTVTGATIAAAYLAILRVGLAGGASGTAATGEAAAITSGQQTLIGYEQSLINSEPAVHTTLPALVTIDAYYNATPASSTLDAVAAGAGSPAQVGGFYTGAYLHGLGYSDPNVWTILASQWGADTNSAFNKLYAGFGTSYSAFITAVYTQEFGFAPSAANLQTLVNDVPGVQQLLSGGGAGPTPIQIVSGIYGYLLYVGQTTPSLATQYAVPANSFLLAAAKGTVSYGPELTVQFPAGSGAAAALSATAGGAAMLSSDPAVITISGSDQLVVPGAGASTIRFLAGSGTDTLVPHAGAEARIYDFDPITDVLDVRSLLTGTGLVLPGEVAALNRYLAVADQGAGAVLNFDPAGRGGGTNIATSRGSGASVTGLDTLIGQRAIRMT